MIYMLSDSELRVLCNSVPFNCSVRSPIINLVEDNNRIEGGMLEETRLGLCDLGLLEKSSDTETYGASAQGLLLTKILMCPEKVMTVGRKKSDDGYWYCCEINDIWYLLSRNEERKINTVFAYFDTQTFCKWLDEQFLKGYAKTIEPPCDINLTLNYNEWFMFLLSQYVYMKRDNNAERSEWISRSEMTDVNPANYLKVNFKNIEMPNLCRIVDAVLEQNSPEMFEMTLASLVKKGVFTSRVDEDGEERFSLTNVSVAWLDNDLLTDTLFVDFKSDYKSYTMLFSLRKTGICAMVDNSKSVRFVSAKKIPWEAYVK